MHCVGSYGIEMDKNMRDCRAAVNDILDRGLMERRKAINGLLQTLYKHFPQTSKATKEDTQELQRATACDSDCRRQDGGSGRHL